MAQSLAELLRQYLSPQAVVFIISMLPILELRGGLIAASLLGLSWLQAAVIGIVGNTLPIPVILLCVQPVLSFLGKFRPFRRICGWLERKAYKKGAELTAKYPRRIQLALFLFVAIPLPGTGAWTGSLIAAFLGIDFRRALPAIALGVVGASLIMLLISYVIPTWIGIKG